MSELNSQFDKFLTNHRWAVLTSLRITPVRVTGVIR